MSAFTKKQPLPVDTTSATRWSTEIYDKEDLSVSMPSLMLVPQGDDKSIINLHFPGLFFLGIIPSGLM